MPIKLALTGKPKSGKTTAILKLVDSLKRNEIKVGGIYTIEIKKDAKRVGFEIVDILTGNSEILAKVDQESNIKVGKYGVKVQALEEIGVKALENGLKDCQVIVIDEVGPMELKSELFRKVIRQVLASDKPTVFTVHYKSDDELVKEVKTKSELYELTPNNRKKIVPDLIDEFMKSLSPK